MAKHRPRRNKRNKMPCMVCKRETRLRAFRFAERFGGTAEAPSLIFIKSKVPRPFCEAHGGQNL